MHKKNLNIFSKNYSHLILVSRWHVYCMHAIGGENDIGDPKYEVILVQSNCWVFHYCNNNKKIIHKYITLSKLSLLISLFVFFIFCILSLNYRSPNYLGRNSCRSFPLLKAIAISFPLLFAINKTREKNVIAKSKNDIYGGAL